MIEGAKGGGFLSCVEVGLWLLSVAHAAAVALVLVATGAAAFCCYFLLFFPCFFKGGVWLLSGSVESPVCCIRCLDEFCVFWWLCLEVKGCVVVVVRVEFGSLMVTLSRS